MNKRALPFVSVSVRASRFIFFASSAVLLSSCSSSRTVNADLRVPPGRSLHRTVKESDVYIAKGSTLEVDYSERNRYFVQEGGALVGFRKGANLTRIYAEKGAIIPNAGSQRGVSVYTVKDASATYRNRFKELVPAEFQVRGGNRPAVTPVVGVGVGSVFWGGWGWNGWGRRSRGSVRTQAVRVRSSSYKRKD